MLMPFQVIPANRQQYGASSEKMAAAYAALPMAVFFFFFTTNLNVSIASFSVTERKTAQQWFPKAMKRQPA